MPTLPALLIQIGVILLVSRTCGAILRKIHQPQVMGEMVGGILLGPSFLGWLSPSAERAIFPASTEPILDALSQVGLILFMFLVGLELEPRILKKCAPMAAVLAPASLLFPFLAGTLLGLALYPRLSPGTVPQAHFALFLGTAMSVTAFPVLARILQERRLIRTRLGSITLACAAAADVLAWTVLAFVVLLVRANGESARLWRNLGGSLLFTAIMIFVARPVLAHAVKRRGAEEGMTQNLLTFLLLLVFTAAWVTDRLGIHALFGAFLVGAIVPRGLGIVKSVGSKMSDVTTVLLLPLFFASTGLRTRVSAVSGAEMWLLFGAIVGVATIGKLGASAVAARMTGMTWREAGAFGLLMNTRGLMELVIAGVGLELGIISHAVFAMLVLMAIVTTFAATPLLDLVHPVERRSSEEEPAVADARTEGSPEEGFADAG